MFDKEFYPTPESVAQQMLFNHDITDKIILEPHGGKGDLIDAIKQLNPKSILTCEKNTSLAKLVANKAQFICSDFFDVKDEQISHIDFIIMNPPFSNAISHVEHAWKIAPDGCTIISLINYANLDKYSYSKDNLFNLISDYGSKQNLGNVFSTAERKTDVEVGLITLYKPKSENETEFDGFFDLSEEYEKQESGIIKHNEIKELVNRYVGAVNLFNEVEEINDRMTKLISPINHNEFEFGAFQKQNNGKREIDRATFKKELQKTAWNEVFKKFNMQKYVTQSVLNDINKFVEMQSNVPFTLKNIYKMVELIAGTHKQRMDKVLIDAFEQICGFSDKNNSIGKGWKTNSDYKINQKFIHPYVTEHDSRWPNDYVSISYRGGNSFSDILKALCYISGKNYDDMISLSGLFATYRYEGNKRIETGGVMWGQWVNWNDLFRVKGFKKGTMHFEFIDLDLWHKFNYEVARIKGWRLPSKTDSKVKGTERTKSNGVVIY